MNLIAFQNAARTFYSVAQKGFWWWISELMTMVPERIRRAVTQPEITVFADISDQEIILTCVSAEIAQELGRLKTHSGPTAPDLAATSYLEAGASVIVRLAQKKVLRKKIELPIAIEPYLRQSLGLQLEYHIPMSADAVYFDARVMHRDVAAGKISVELVVVPKEVSDQAVAACQKLGWIVEAVSMLPEVGRENFAFDFLNADHNPGRIARIYKQNLLLGGMAIILLIGLVMVVDMRRQRELISMSEQVEEARVSAQNAQQIRDEIMALAHQHQLMMDKKRTSAILPVLTDLAVALPDTAWLTGVQWDRKSVLLTGLSVNASTLIDSIKGVKNIQNAHFPSAITKDGTENLEHFSISFQPAPK